MASKKSFGPGWISLWRMVNCWRRSASSSAQTLIWKCWRRQASAMGSRTTLAISPDAHRGSHHPHCSSLFRTARLFLQTNPTSPCPRLVGCIRATIAANSPLPNTDFVCRPAWTTAPSNLRNGTPCAPNRSSSPQPLRRGRLNNPAECSQNRLFVQLDCSTPQSKFVLSTCKSMIYLTKCAKSLPMACARL